MLNEDNIFFIIIIIITINPEDSIDMRMVEAFDDMYYVVIEVAEIYLQIFLL